MKSEIENAAVKVRLFLRDDLTKKELAGAKLQILDEDGKILHAVSTENTEGKGCLILGLNPEKTYRIVEVLPRKGYKKEILIPDSMKDILKQEQKQEVTFFCFTAVHRGNDGADAGRSSFQSGKCFHDRKGENFKDRRDLKRSIQKAWNCTGIMEPDEKPGLVIKQEA